MSDGASFAVMCPYILDPLNLFVCRTEFADGMWAGVELQKPVGKNDGSVNGVKYFECIPNHGVFVRPESVR